MFYRRWIAACTAGELIGIGTATMAALAVNAVIGEPQSTPTRLFVLAIFVAVGAIEGGALAFFQWRVLRSRLPRLRAGEWIGVTVAVAVAVAGWIAGMTPSLFASQAETAVEEPGLAMVLVLAAIAGALAGGCFGAAQWLVLRRHAERSGRWVWIHVLAWAFAMAAIFLGAALPDADWAWWAIGVSGVGGGVLGGVLLGAMSGVVARDLSPWVDEAHWSLDGRVSVVTGANSELGREIALGLARLGSDLVVVCRRTGEAERIAQEIRDAVRDADVSVATCDLTNLASIRTCAAGLLASHPRLDLLVHNAGATFPQRTVTGDGIEATLAVDVVGPHLLTALLKERLEICRGRVISLTGIYHRKGQLRIDDLTFTARPYSWLSANNQAQRGRFLFINELARRSPAVMAAAVHPGAVLTGAQVRMPWYVRALVRTVARPGFVRPEVGAIPVIRLAAQPDGPQWSGRFFNRCAPTDDKADAETAAAFWQACEALTGTRFATGEG